MRRRGAGSRWCRRLAAALLAALLPALTAVPAAAQVPDSTQAPADTAAVRVVPDTAGVVLDTLARPPRLPVGFAPPEPGAAAGDTLPVRTPALDVPGLLADLPGGFVYDFGAPGWPDGWSPYGLPPHAVGLAFDGVPLDDPVAGRPRYDLLPLAFVDPLRTRPARLGAPVTVLAEGRAFVADAPLTEARYRTSSTGLQSVTVVHVQQRRLTLFGRTGGLQVLFGYGGHASDGEYEGSRLARARQLLGRLRYARPGWTLELRHLYNRRRVGAHGGVMPLGAFETVYDRLAARVDDPRARRQTIRSDLDATLRARLVPGLEAPLTATAFWTAHTLRFRHTADTLDTRADRLGVRLEQSARVAGQRLSLRLEGWRTAVVHGTALPDALARTEWHAAVRETLAAGRLAAVVEAGVHGDGSRTYPSAEAGATLRLGPAQLFANAAYTGQPVPWTAEAGFGGTLEPASVGAPRTALGRAGMRVRGGAFDLSVFGFATAERDPFDYAATARDDTAAVLTSPTAVRGVGVAADLGWRRTARRGVYATVQPTVQHTLDADASTLHRRRADALPVVFGRARLGARYRLFRGDLDLDLYLQGRAWSELRSRTLHRQTGLLILPPAGAQVFGPSGTLDVVAEAGVRTAKLFLAYENVLSGTSVMAGTLLVPVYPLPEQRLRFGVFWPIFD